MQTAYVVNKGTVLETRKILSRDREARDSGRTWTAANT